MINSDHLRTPVRFETSRAMSQKDLNSYKTGVTWTIIYKKNTVYNIYKIFIYKILYK